MTTNDRLRDSMIAQYERDIEHWVKLLKNLRARMRRASMDTPEQRAAYRDMLIQKEDLERELANLRAILQVWH